MLAIPVAAAAGPTRAPAARRLMVDAPTRMFHALFALTFLGAYVTADSEHWRLLHVSLGYTFAGLLGFRVLYGLVGPRQAGLALLARRVAGAPAWLRSVRVARSLSDINGRQGLSLATALAIVSMLVLALPLALSGYGSYSEWGDWLEAVHAFLGNALLTLALAHLGFIAALSVLRRQNLALPMITGHVGGSGPSVVQHNRARLAGLLLLAVVAFGAWQWREAQRGVPAGQEAARAVDGPVHRSVPGRDDDD